MHSPNRKCVHVLQFELSSMPSTECNYTCYTIQNIYDMYKCVYRNRDKTCSEKGEKYIKEAKCRRMKERKKVKCVQCFSDELKDRRVQNILHRKWFCIIFMLIIFFFFFFLFVFCIFIICFITIEEGRVHCRTQSPISHVYI